MNNIDMLIRAGAVAGAIIALITLAVSLVKYFRPIKESLEIIVSVVERSADMDEALLMLLKDRLSMVANLVIQRGWHTITERQVLEGGLKTYENLGGNSQLGIKVKMALKTEVKPDPFFTKGIESERENREDS